MTTADEDADARPLLALGEALGRAIYECDAQGHLRVASDRLADLTSRMMPELLGGPLDLLCAPTDRERVRAARAAAAPGQRLVLEYDLLGLAGAPPVPVQDVAVARAAGGGGLRLTGVIEDLRPRRRAEALLVERARSDALAQLASGVAHEVNNALSGVLNYAQLAQRSPPGSPHLSEALEGVLSEGQRILEMTRALLTYTPSTAPRPVQVGDLVRAALAPIRRELREELIAVDAALPADVPPVQALGHDLQAALHHVIGWAREALRARGPGKKTLTLRAAWAGGDDVTIDVDAAAAGLARAAAGDLDAALSVERCRELLARVGARLEAQGSSARLLLPLA